MGHGGGAGARLDGGRVLDVLLPEPAPVGHDRPRGLAHRRTVARTPRGARVLRGHGRRTARGAQRGTSGADAPRRGVAEGSDPALRRIAPPRAGPPARGDLHAVPQADPRGTPDHSVVVTSRESTEERGDTRKGSEKNVTKVTGERGGRTR